MIAVRSLSILGLVSLLGAACSTTDPGGTATAGATDSSTSNPSGIGSDETAAADPSGPDQPTTGHEGGQTDTGETTAESTFTGGTIPDPATTTTSQETDATATTTPPDTSVSDTDTVETTGTTTTADTDGTSTADTTDATTGTTTTGDETTDSGEESCQAPVTQPPCDAGTDDIFKAIGLNCSNDKSMAIPIKNPVITAPDANSYRVATHFGSAKDPMDASLWQWGPREGERLLAINTGVFTALQNDGSLIEPNTSVSTANGNPDDLFDLPGVMTFQKGSKNGMGGTPFMNCDGVKDCSDTLFTQWKLGPDNTANDAFYMSFDLDVPAGTHGYLLDFAYFSQEWPLFVNKAFNDMLVVWSTSESFTGNVTFIDNQPLTVTALNSYMTIKPKDPLLAGTGFPDNGIDNSGAATGWFTAKGSATPGESFTVAISVFDVGDDVLDTIGLIDKFRWDCVGCVPSEIDSCGVVPQ